MDRNERIRIFNETLALCKENPQLIESVKHSTDNQKIYLEGEEISFTHSDREDAAEIRLTDSRTVNAAKKYSGQRVCILNFASSVTPGGGVVNGSSAQEESICRVTTLYPSLSDDKAIAKFYYAHRIKIDNYEMSRANNDDCIYTPDVIALRDDYGSLSLLDEKDRYSFDVITCAAPDLRHGRGAIDLGPDEIFELFCRRISRILTVAAVNNVEVMILGAFGCGAFGNDPAIASLAFRKSIQEYIHDFKVIDFAIPNGARSDGNYREFKKGLNL